MRLHVLTAFAALSFCLAGCATAEKGTSQEIAVTTPPATGALCTLTNTRGRWQVLTPGAANVLRSKDDLQVSCRKPGWNDAVATNKSISAAHSGWGPLAGVAWEIDQVDAMTGALNDYTPKMDVPMTPVAPAAPPPAAPAPAPKVN